MWYYLTVSFPSIVDNSLFAWACWPIVGEAVNCSLSRLE